MPYNPTIITTFRLQTRKSNKQWVHTHTAHTYLLPVKEQHKNHEPHDSATKMTFFVNIYVWLTVCVNPS